MTESFMSCRITAASAVGIMPLDGESTTVARRTNTYTPATWTSTSVALSGSPTLVAHGVVVGDMVVHTASGAWGTITAIDDSTDTLTVKGWHSPYPGNGNLGYLPSGAGAGTIHIYPASMLSGAKATKILGVAFSDAGTSPSALNITALDGNIIKRVQVASGLDSEYDEVGVYIRGPWYMTCTVTGGTPDVTVQFETIGEVDH